MKVIINVWEADKPHNATDGMPMTKILEYDEFEYPEVIGLDVPIERCRFNSYPNTLIIYLDEYPARIDADFRFSNIHLLSKDKVKYHPEVYTILDTDKGKGVILWTNPNIKVAKEAS